MSPRLPAYAEIAPRPVQRQWLRVLRRAAVAAALLAGGSLLTACVSQAPQSVPSAPATPAAPSGLGRTKATAIEVCRPQGERAYLSQLECAGGERPKYRRVGSFGPRTPVPPARSDADVTAQLKRALSARALRPGEPDIHIVDGYEVVCNDATHMIYMDMYHCEQPAPTVAPPGFRLRPVQRGIASN